MNRYRIEGTVRGASVADVLNKLRDKVIGLKVVEIGEPAGAPESDTQVFSKYLTQRRRDKRARAK